MSPVDTERLNSSIYPDSHHAVVHPEDRAAPQLPNLADYVTQIVLVLTMDGAGEYFNPHWESYTGFAAAESTGRGWIAAVHRQDVEELQEQLRQRSGEDAWEFEARLRRGTDGSYRRHICRCSLIAVPAAEPARLVILCTDVEDARKAEAAANEQAMLLGQTLRSYEEEKRRLAHGLHDSAAQYLVALQMKLDALQRWSLGNTGRKNALVEECRELSKRCWREIRATSYLLYPPLLEDLGLEAAIHLHADSFMERTKVKVDADIEANLGRLDRDLEIALFRAVQEALASLHRDCGSKKIQIKIGNGPTTVFAEVEGEVCGEPVTSEILGWSHCPFGASMATLRQRIQNVGGAFDVESLTGTVLIRAVVPRRALIAHACD